MQTPHQEGFSFHDVVRPHGYPHSASHDVDTPEERNAFWNKHKYNAWELIHRYATLRYRRLEPPQLCPIPDFCNAPTVNDHIADDMPFSSTPAWISFSAVGPISPSGVPQPKL